MNRARVAHLLRELLTEIEGEPAKAGPARKRRRIHNYKPKHDLTESDLRAARQNAAKRGIPL